MPPYQISAPEVREADEGEVKVGTPQLQDRTYEILKIRTIIFGYWHLVSLYGMYLCFTEAKWATIVMACVLFTVSNIGITAGSHRLWSHRSYKAKWPLQLLLLIMSSCAGQYSAFNWARDHRLHHKFSDTDADPHNARRGFLYSHIGWLVVKKHPDVREKGKTIDLSDLYANRLLMFQHKHYIAIITTICYVLPTLTAMLCWGESFNVAYHVNTTRFVLSMNAIFTINSVAHMWGNRPYDKNILPSQSHGVSLVTYGEGFHNYHHTFPWDYKAAELGNNSWNLTTKFIDLFAYIGWAYDLKTVTDDMIRSRARRTGDGTDLWGRSAEM